MSDALDYDDAEPPRKQWPPGLREAAVEFRAERDADDRRRLKAQPPIAPVRADFEHFEQIEQCETADANPWPKPDQRIVEDGRASPPTLDSDAQPTGWGEWIAKEAAARERISRAALGIFGGMQPDRLREALRGQMMG